MKAYRGCVFTLASLALSFALSTPARADVRSIDPAQTLARPPGSAFTYWGTDVAIDGGHIIVLAVTRAASKPCSTGAATAMASGFFGACWSHVPAPMCAPAWR